MGDDTVEILDTGVSMLNVSSALVSTSAVEFKACDDADMLTSCSFLSCSGCT